MSFKKKKAGVLVHTCNLNNLNTCKVEDQESRLILVTWRVQGQPELRENLSFFFFKSKLHLELSQQSIKVIVITKTS